MNSGVSVQAVAGGPNVSHPLFANGCACPPGDGYNVHWHPKIENGLFIRYTVRLHMKEHGGRCQMGAAEIGLYFTRRCLAMGSAGRLASPAAGAPAPPLPPRRASPRHGDRVATVAWCPRGFKELQGRCEGLGRSGCLRCGKRCDGSTHPAVIGRAQLAEGSPGPASPPPLPPPMPPPPSLLLSAGAGPGQTPEVSPSLLGFGLCWQAPTLQRFI